MNGRIHSDGIGDEMRACPIFETAEDRHGSGMPRVPCDTYSGGDRTQWRRHARRGARVMIIVLAAGLCERRSARVAQRGGDTTGIMWECV